MLNTLIVDDDPVFRQIVREILISKFSPISVSDAANGKEALQEFDTHRPDIVFMDIKLSDTNGIELTRKLKELDPKVPIVILTNHDILQYREAAFEHGADYFISKASTIENEIEAAVQSACFSRNQIAK